MPSPSPTSDLTPDLTSGLPALRGPQIDRRHLMRGTIAVAAAAGVVTAAGGSSAIGAQSLPAWSDPATWGTAGVPRPGTVVAIDFPVRLDRDVQVAGLHIACGGRLVLDPAKSVSIRSTGNVEVCGVLEMRPNGPKVEHLLRFEGIDERKFVGGGMDIVPTDVGLWLHEDGQLDLRGTPRTAWVRADGSLAPGTRTLRLAASPVGWQVGDELVVTPTGSPVDNRHKERFDEVRIAAVSGSTVTLTSGLRYGHPAISVGDGYVMTAEVMNLTRNVKVEGTPEGRTHTVAMHNTQPSQVRYAAFRHFGPRQADGAYTEGVLGRYGMHWHMCGDGSRGTVLEGVVMRDGGNHAYVPHESHGITFRSCLSYDTVETPYWWDLPATTRALADESHDIAFESCVAAKVASIPWFRGFRLAGFQLGAGEGNSAVNCVATGVLGAKDSSGFHWPEGSIGNWEFAGCITHNNARHGIFTWQNSNMNHVVKQFVSYHNSGHGLSHGAYRNSYLYRDAILYGNVLGGVLLHAVSRDDRRLSLVNLLIDAAGLSDTAVNVGFHQLATQQRTLISGCRFRGYRDLAVSVNGSDNGDPAPNVDLIDIVGCSFSGNQLWIADQVRSDSQVRLTTGSGSYSARPMSFPTGTVEKEWHARTTKLPRFRPPAEPTRLTLSLKRAAV